MIKVEVKQTNSWSCNQFILLTYLQIEKNGILITDERVQREKNQVLKVAVLFFSSVTAKCNDGTFSWARS